MHRAPWSPALTETCPAVTRGDWCCPSGAGHAQGQTHTFHRWPVSESGVVQTGWHEPLPSGCHGSSPSNVLFSDTEREEKVGISVLIGWDKRPVRANLPSVKSLHSAILLMPLHGT